MSEKWLDIAADAVDVEEIMREIRQRLAQENDNPSLNPVKVADTLWKEMIGNSESPLIANRIPIRPRDCDIAPRNYKIEWRIPFLGPLHAIVRRVIDNEIRLFLFPSLDKQIRYNRRALWVMRALTEENMSLREEIDNLKNEITNLKKSISK